ncbi:MAG: hypothetical protein L6427_01625 [Actinomycetia bacterium]|nr:hypothetical protein [Actinomycetes bacterium]
MREFWRHLKSALKISLAVVLLAALTVGSVGCKGNRVEVTTSKSSAPEHDGEELEGARAEAKARLDQACAALADLQGMGMDTTDLGEYINNAQTSYDNAKTPEEYMGLTESAAYWANVVINCCQEKKEAYLAALAEEEEDTKENEEVENGNEEPPPGDWVEGEIQVYFVKGVTGEQVYEVAARYCCTVKSIIPLREVGVPENEAPLVAFLLLPEGKSEEVAIQEFEAEPLVDFAKRVPVGEFF